MANEM